MQVFDIGNPASPILAGSLTTGTGPASVSVSGNYAYVANFGNSNAQVINLMCSGNFAVTVNPTTGQTTALPLQWNTIGYNIYNVNSGNVGIGTSTPAFKLTTSFTGGVTNSIPTTGTSDPNAGFRLTTGAIALDMGTYNSGGSYIQNRQISNFATPYQLVLQPGGGGVSIGGYNAAFAQAPFTCTIYGTANCTSNSWSSSDVRYKKNIQTIGNALQRVMVLRGVSYDFKTEEFASLNFEKEKQIGVIAQEVEKIFPELVKTDQEGFKAVNYDKIGPILIEAMKEQQAQIETLKSENAEMKSEIISMNDCVRSLCNTSQTTSDSKTTSTAVVESRLFQNQPNPFNRSTVIRYTLSDEHNQGIIVIRDLNGNLVKSIAVNNTGKGQVTVTANEFAPGTYTYSLEIAGESIDTKLMVLTK